MKKTGVGAGQLWQSWLVHCLYCFEGSHAFRHGNMSRTRAEKQLRKHGWMKTAKGWAHKACHKGRGDAARQAAK